MFSGAFLAILFGLFLGGIGIPTSSEILLPLAGAMIKHGQVGMVTAFVACVLVQIGGSIVAYWIGRTGGVRVVQRYGKYFLFSEHKLEMAQAQFRRYGTWMVLVGRCVPILVSYISFPAGIAGMRFGTFVLMTTIGSIIWVAGLLTLGYMLADQLDVITHTLHQLSLVIAVVIVLAAIWYVRRLRASKD